MATETGRINPTLHREKVEEALPEYFQGENPKFIEFLDEYYKILNAESGNYNFGTKIESVINARDVVETPEEFLDQVIGEIGNGLRASNFFAQPRLMARLLARFYQAKGSVVSAEGFFRGFFNEEIEVIYPKRDIFIVGESRIGPESGKVIQDGGVYQILSILIRCGLSVSDYQDLYKRFVHPAGFHFRGEVLLASEANLGIQSGTGTDPREEIGNIRIYESDAAMSPGTLFGEHTGIINGVRFSFAKNRLDRYGGISLSSLDAQYDSLADMISPNSPTTRSDVNSSSTIETSDQGIFDDNEEFIRNNP